MEFTVFRDLPSLAFVRCTSPIPGTIWNAEGVAFSLRTAVEKCRSELLERSFFRALPQEEQSTILGIAAHPEMAAAEEHAWCESLETLFLEAIREKRPVRGLTFPLPGGIRLLLSRLDRRWIVLLRFPHEGTQSLVQSVSKSLSRALLRSWTEFRNLRIYRPTAAELPTYTKGNRILGNAIERLRLLPGLSSNIAPLPLAAHIAKSGSHFIVYFNKENQL